MKNKKERELLALKKENEILKSSLKSAENALFKKEDCASKLYKRREILEQEIRDKKDDLIELNLEIEQFKYTLKTELIILNNG